MSRRVLGVLIAATVAGCADSSSTEPEAVVVPVFSHQAGDPHGAELHFKTHLTGDEEVPPNEARGQGQAIFRLSKDGTSMHYKLIVSNIENVFMAHIHTGAFGTNGPIVVWLYPQCQTGNAAVCGRLIEGRTQGVLDEGTLTSADVRAAGPFTNLTVAQRFAALIAEIRSGNTYVNVHTTQLPGGEIRGQLPN